MSKIFDKESCGYKFHIEKFNSAMEVAEINKKRIEMTDGSFHNVRTKSYDGFEGVSSFAEAEELLVNGYQPTVNAMRGVFKATKAGTRTRFSFQNNVVGFAPVVPLALKNVPNSMISMTMKPIKAKVIDIYYDMTANCGVESEDIIKAGQALLGTIIEMERQGYRFNLYAVQTYSDKKPQSCDMLVVKVKSDHQPLDLKRISFPLTHTAFFRAIGFDWYSRVPGGTYRFRYGRAISYDNKKDKVEKMAKELFGQNAVWFSCTEIMKKDKEYIREVVSDGNSKA